MGSPSPLPRHIGSASPAALHREADSFAHALDAAFCVGEGTFLLGEACTGQDHIGVDRGLGHEDVLYHQEVQSLQRLASVIEVGIGGHGVFRHDVERLHGPGVSGVDHLDQGQPDLLRKAVNPQARSNLPLISGSVTR